MTIRRTERHWPVPALSGLSVGIMVAVGCSSSAPPATGAPTTTKPIETSSSAPAPDAATVDATTDPMSNGDAGDPDAEADGGVEASATGDGSVVHPNPGMCGFSACAPGAPCPDLVIDADDLRLSTVINHRTFTTTDCALVEGCIVQPGDRRLLRFDTATQNLGTADLVIGDPTGAGSTCFQFSQCHQHYHFQGFSQYTLFQTDGTTVAAAGHKQSFCLDDVEQAPQAPGPQPDTLYTCQNQGIHVGWEDVYPNDIDCQWIDITGVPAGNYLLTVAINTAGYLPESNYENDTATVPIVIPPE